MAPSRWMWWSQLPKVPKLLERLLSEKYDQIDGSGAGLCNYTVIRDSHRSVT